MKNISFRLNDNINIQEFEKVISFISEKIIKYKRNECEILLEIENDANEEEIKEEIERMSKKYIANIENDKIVYESKVKKESFYDEFNTIHFFDDKILSLSNQALFLFNYFDDMICDMVYKFFNNKGEILEKQYPVLLPIEGYKKTGYLKRSPQYAILCCPACENIGKLNEFSEIEDNRYFSVLNKPTYSLSPSACFHVYEEYKNTVLKKNTIITFRQSVFRNEGRFNYSELGRLQDYHVREIVFIGNEDFVRESRMNILKETKKIIESMELDASITIASDPFILPQMQRYKKIQIIDKSKYELRVSYEKDKNMSVASFNLHGTAFTHPFNILVQDNDTVTGCVGYGLERMVLAFLSQFGEDAEKWPTIVKNAYFNNEVK